MNLGIYSYWSCLTTLTHHPGSIRSFLGIEVDSVMYKHTALKIVTLADLLPVLVALPLVLGRREHACYLKGSLCDPVLDQVGV